MSPPVFVADRDTLLAGPTVTLAGAEGRHAARVQRLRVGERLDLVDGAGLLVEGEVTAVEPDGLVAQVRTRREVPPPDPRLVVVQAVPKGERGELAVELLTELGADVIVPWAASRCVVRWRGERGDRALARWRATAREAGKQSRRARFPEVAALASTSDVVRLLAGAALPLVLHEEAAKPLATVAPPARGDVVVVVGPEGGVAPEELDAFAAVDARAVRLGPTVLRTSTAGAAALAVVLAATPRWR